MLVLQQLSTRAYETMEINKESMNPVIANQNTEDSVYLPTTRKRMEAQQDQALNKQAEKDGFLSSWSKTSKYSVKMAKCYTKKPTTLHNSLVSLLLATPRDHESHRNSLSFDVLERSTNESLITCQKVSQLPGEQAQTTKILKTATKLAITNPWEALCVDLIGPYTLKGKDITQIDFMCVTMINPATSWFEIVELPISQYELDIPTGTRSKRARMHISKQNKPTLTKHQRQYEQ